MHWNAHKARLVMKLKDSFRDVDINKQVLFL